MKSYKVHNEYTYTTAIVKDGTQKGLHEERPYKIIGKARLIDYFRLFQQFLLLAGKVNIFWLTLQEIS